MHVNIEEHLLYRMWRVLKEKSLVHVVPEPVRVFIACSESCFYRWFKVGYSNEWWAVRPMGQEGKIPFLSHMYSTCTVHLKRSSSFHKNSLEMRYYMDQLIGKDFQLWSLWPKSDTKVRCWPAWVPHTYLARCRFGLHGYSVAPCLGDIKNRLGGFEESGCSWDVQVLLNQSVLPLTMLLPWAQDVELAKPQICRSSGLTLKHWLRRFPWRRGIAASASRISLVSLVLVVLISIDSEIRFIFLVFQVLGAWPPVSCAAFYWCRTSSGRPSVLQLLSWRFIVQLMDFVHRPIWIIWSKISLKPTRYLWHPPCLHVSQKRKKGAGAAVQRWPGFLEELYGSRWCLFRGFKWF